MTTPTMLLRAIRYLIFPGLVVLPLLMPFEVMSSIKAPPKHASYVPQAGPPLTHPAVWVQPQRGECGATAPFMALGTGNRQTATGRWYGTTDVQTGGVHP
jgi:hypothetical protein